MKALAFNTTSHLANKIMVVFNYYDTTYYFFSQLDETEAQMGNRL